MDLEKAYDMVNREALRQMLRMYDVGGKLTNGIKSMYVNSISCLRVKGGDSVSGTIVMWDKVVSYSLGFSMCIWTQC